MLSLDTCKKLKEAGFPQDFEDGYDDTCAKFWAKEEVDEPNSYWFAQEDIVDGRAIDGEFEILCKIPTLSELISACEDEFFALTHYDEGKYSKGWFASRMGKFDSGPKKPIVHGNSPEEAVANLYILIKTNE